MLDGLLSRSCTPSIWMLTHDSIIFRLAKRTGLVLQVHSSISLVLLALLQLDRCRALCCGMSGTTTPYISGKEGNSSALTDIICVYS